MKERNELSPETPITRAQLIAAGGVMSKNRQAMLTYRAKWKAAGKCSRCGHDRKNPRWKTCGNCRGSRTRNIRNTEALKSA